MLLIVVAQNQHRCDRCRRGRGIVDRPMEKRLCPVDGETCLAHAQSGKCPEGLLAVDSGESPADAPPPRAIGGPGTELKKLLAKVGIVAVAACRCNAMAAAMDFHGGAWSLENMDAIVDTMRSEAGRRCLPFLAAAARVMVRRAVRKAAANNRP